jgi:hypothetical protein
MVDPAIGTVMVDGKAVSSVVVEKTFDSIDAAKAKAIDLEVEDAMGMHAFDLRPYLVTCEGRAIGTLEREDASLYLAAGSDGPALVFEGASCFGTEGSYTAVARR